VRPPSSIKEIRSEQIPVRRDVGAALADMAAFSEAAIVKSIMDTTLLKSAKLELRMSRFSGTVQ